MRAAAIAAAGLLGLALVAAWLGPGLLDWNRYRDGIAGLASARLGRPVRITGLVSLALLPHPVLTAAGVTMPDPGDGFSAEVAEMRLQVGLGALLAGQLEARDIVLQGPHLRLPWPLPMPAADWLTELHAQVEDGTVLVGGLVASGIAGTFSADPLTGTLSVDGLAVALGQPWRVTARLGRPGGDGSATLEASLDGQGSMQDTGATLSGQFAPNGTLTGLVTGRGRDLSQLVAGPALPWHAAGRLRAEDGLAAAESLDVEIGGVPARGGVALRLLPAARLDAALAASRLDLAAWLPGLLQGGAVRLPASLDISAESATLAGGTLRRVHAVVDVGATGVGVHDATALLPGDAALSLSGRIAGGRFAGAGRIAAPDLRRTWRWLQPLAPAFAATLPPGVLREATLTAEVTADAGQLALDNLAGEVDGSAVTGALTLRAGDQPALSASLHAAGLALDPWLPDGPPGPPALDAALAAWPGRWAAAGLALVLSADRPSWHGVTLDTLEVDAALLAGTLTVRRAVVAGPEFSLSLSGALAPGGRVSDGRLQGSLAHTAWLGATLPAGWPARLLQGPAAVQATVSGDPAALALTAKVSLGDLRLDLAGAVDLRRPHWDGTLAVHHPGAPRLLEALGVPGVAPWLGDGSFSLAAATALDPARLALSGLTLSAGLLRMAGDVALERGATVQLTGRLDAETLPLPLPYARSREPIEIRWLQGWQARVGVSAERVLFGLSPGLDHAAAAVSLDDGILRVTGLVGEVAGGKLAGQMTLEAAAPPRVTLDARLTGATLFGPILDSTLDVTGGQLDASASLRTAGFSPEALLAALDGAVQVSVSDGVLAGLDVGAVAAALDGPDPRAGVARALQSGTTAFTRLDAALALQHGVVTAREAWLTAPDGQMSLSGTLDLPLDSADFELALSPAQEGAPAIRLRLIGPAATPLRTPELAELAGWLVGR